MLLTNAPTGKQAKLANTTLAHDIQTEDTYLLDEGTGVKPIGRSPRGFKVEVLDGECATKTVFVQPTTLLT